jgi:hypothetical protein
MSGKKKSRQTDDRPDAAPARRFARTPENILVALGFPTKRENKANLKYWRTFRDFPKRERNGFDVQKLVEFLERHKDEFADLAARAKFIMAQPVPKNNAGALTAGGGQSAEGLENDEPLAPNQTALAEWLSRHFQVNISKQDISDWSKGKRLDGAPAPPIPDAAQRWPKLAWADWYRKCKFHDPAKLAGTPDLFKLVEIEGKKSELERFEHERFLRNKERGQYLEKAEHNRVLSALGNLGRNTLWDLFDKSAYEEFAVRLSGIGLPEEWAQMVMAELRRLNPELLRKYMATMAAEIQANEQAVPVPNNAKVEA